MHDLVIGLSFLAMLMLPSVLALRSGSRQAREEHASLRALTDR